MARKPPTTVSQKCAAAYLGVSRWTVARGMDDGTVPYVQLGPGGHRRVPVQWLLDQLGVTELPEATA